MRFKEHYELNEKLGMGKEYQVPKDREERLYDFYALTMVYPTEYSFNDSQEDERYYFDDALEKITTALLKDFTDVLRFGLSAELGHLGTGAGQIPLKASGFGKKPVMLNTPFKKEYKKELLAIKKWQDEFTGYGDRKYSERYDFYKKLFPDMTDFKDFATMAFDEQNVNWDDGYGGDAWLKIAKGLRQVLTAKEKKMGDKIVAIDHVYDLQHNNDTVFNKVKQYYKYGGHQWLAHALDKKRDVTEPHELIKHVSGPLKRPLTAAYKIVLKKSFDAVPKTSEIDEVEKFLHDKEDGQAIYNEKTGRYDIGSSSIKVNLDGVEDGKLKHKYGKIYNGTFDCSNLGLTSLEGAPTEVNGVFICTHNQLTNLEGMPQDVTYDIMCQNNKLTSLKGTPKKMKSIDCSNNLLTTLEGGPTQAVDMELFGNKLVSLKGAPKKAGSIIVQNNPTLKSLDGIGPGVNDVNLGKHSINPEEIERVKDMGVLVYGIPKKGTPTKKPLKFKPKARYQKEV